MRWDDFRRSENVEDRRGDGGGTGGGFRFPLPGGRRAGGGGLGIGGLIVVGLIAWALGINPLVLIGGLEQIQGPGMEQQQAPSRQGKAGAPGEWRRLARRYQPLAGLEPQAPSTAEVQGKGTFHRVLGGAFATRAEAQAVCGEVCSAGGYCAVVML